MQCTHDGRPRRTTPHLVALLEGLRHEAGQADLQRPRAGLDAGSRRRRVHLLRVPQLGWRAAEFAIEAAGHCLRQLQVGLLHVTEGGCPDA